MRPLSIQSVLLAALGIALSLTVSARADAVTDFYKGKHIDLIISSTVGGGNDLSARLQIGRAHV